MPIQGGRHWGRETLRLSLLNRHRRRRTVRPSLAFSSSCKVMIGTAIPVVLGHVLPLAWRISSTSPIRQVSTSATLTPSLLLLVGPYRFAVIKTGHAQTAAQLKDLAPPPVSASGLKNLDNGY